MVLVKDKMKSKKNKVKKSYPKRDSVFQLVGRKIKPSDVVIVEMPEDVYNFLQYYEEKLEDFVLGKLLEEAENDPNNVEVPIEEFMDFLDSRIKELENEN